MSDEKEIREVMRAERKHKTVKQQEADLRQFMLNDTKLRRGKLFVGGYRAQARTRV